MIHEKLMVAGAFVLSVLAGGCSSASSTSMSSTGTPAVGGGPLTADAKRDMSTDCQAGANGAVEVSASGAPTQALVMTNAGVMANLSLEGTKVTKIG